MVDNRPKCKVVLREYGSGGARIHPRGCRVTGRVETLAGPTLKVNKRGRIKQPKVKIKTREREYNVFVRTNDMRDGAPPYVPFVYDTGATDSTCNLQTARHLGLINADNTPTERYRNSVSWSHATTASNERIRVRKFRRVRFELRETGRNSTASIIILPHGSNLFGVGHMRGQRKYLSIKFK